VASLGSLTLDLILKAGSFEQGLDKAARVSADRVAKIEQANKRAQQGIKKTLLELDRQAAVLGKSGKEQQLYRLQLAGATKEQLAQAEATLKTIDSFDKQEKAQAALIGRFKAYGAAVGIASAAAVAFGAAQTKAAIDAADALSKQSSIVGILTEDLSALGYAAELSDVSMEQLSAGLARFNKNVAASKDVFKELGIALTENDGTLKSNYELINEIADAFAVMEDGARKSSLAQELFGKSGTKLIPLLNGGSAGLKAMADEAQRLGLIIDTETGKAAEEFNDNLTRLSKAADTLGIGLAKDLLPSLTRITSAMIEAQKESGAFEAAWVGLGGVLAEGLGLNDSIEEQIKSINQLLDGDVFDRLRFFGKDGLVEYYSESELRAELDKLKSQVEAQTANTKVPIGIAAAGGGSAAPSGPTKEEIKNAKELTQDYEKLVNKYKEQIAVSKEASEAEQTRYETTKGGLSALTEEQKKYVNSLAAQADTAEKNNEAAKAQQAAAKQLQEAYKGQVEQYQQQIALTGAVTEAERVRYETSKGNLAALSDAQKQNLQNLAAQADAAQKLNELNTTYQGQVESMEREIALTGELTELEKVRYELTQGSLQGLSAAQQQRLEGLAAEKDALAEKAEIEQDLQSLTKDLATEEENALAKRNESLALLSKANEEQLAALGGLAEAHKRVFDQYDEDMEKANEATGEMSEFAKQAARNMQDAFADFLFDPFEDGLDGMLNNFGKILQRMAAEAAAAQIFDAIGSAFGGGSAGGGGFGEWFAGFFDTGGMIGSGQFGIVGERGPEIVRGPAMITSRKETERIMSGSSLSIGNMVFPNVTNAREAREAAGAAARQLTRIAGSGQRYQ
jgi:hypothetical protein